MTQQRRRLSGRRLRAWEATSGTCWYCGTVVGGILPGLPVEIDHQIPVTREVPGLALRNKKVVACCPPCNRRKGQRTVEEYRAHLLVAYREALVKAYQLASAMEHRGDTVKIAALHAAVDEYQIRFWGEYLGDTGQELPAEVA